MVTIEINGCASRKCTNETHADQKLRLMAMNSNLCVKVCTTNRDMWSQKRYLKVYIHIQTKQIIKSWLFCINMHTKHTYANKERIEADIKSYKLIK